MALETHPGLERTLKQVDQWLYYRFDERCTARFADGLKEEVSASLSPKLRDRDRENILEGYGKRELSKIFESYFAKQYVMSKRVLDLVQDIDDTLGDDDQRIMGNVVSAASRTVKFVDGLCQNSGLNEEAIEIGFVATYGTPDNFSSAYLAIVELVLYDVIRKKTPTSERRTLGGLFAGLHNIAQEMEMYTDLLTRETLRTQQEFMPRVAHKVIEDLYTK